MATNFKKDFANARSRKPDLTTFVYGKVPPQAVDLEEAVIGACLLEKETTDTVMGIIANPECFYMDAHQKIYAQIIEMRNSGLNIDLLTVTEYLRRSGDLEVIGGAYYLTRLSMMVMSSAHAETHSRIIMEKYMLREAIRISGHTISDAYENDADVFEILDKTSECLYQIQSQNIIKAPQTISGVAQSTLAKMVEQSKSPNEFTGIPTGFKELNELTKGWQPGNFNIIAARPSVGKTAFAIALLMVSATAGFPTALFSLEMSASEIMTRMVACISEVEMSQLTNPKNLTADEWKRVEGAIEVISGLKIFIDDSAGMTEVEMRAKARRLKQKHDIKMILVDYLQLMTVAVKDGNREQEISKISRTCKTVAKELGVPFFALSQMNRGIESDNGEAKRDPRLSDLRESGAIEQDADNVFFIFEPSAKLIQEVPFFAGKMAIKCAKGRNIGIGNIALEFNRSIQRWRDPIKQEVVYAPPKPDNPSAGMKPTNTSSRPPAEFWNNT